MSKIFFVDLNRSLVQKVSQITQLKESWAWGDYFMYAYTIPRAVLMTASNPLFTFGGGIDAGFREHFPKLCEYKRMKGGDMERIGNVVFAITVDEHLKATKEQVEKALQFAIDNTYEGETLLLSGVGTGIGGLSEDDFVDVLTSVLRVK